MSDILDIKRALEGRARDVAEHLLPNGVLDGREWCVGSTAGEKGKSLKVCVAGAKKGVWTDFAEGGDGGDMIDLWCAVRRIKLVEALDEIRAYLGMQQPRFERQERTYKRPDKPKCSAPKSAVKEYLTSRGVSDDAIRLYRVAEDGRVMVFPSLVNGELIHVKFLKVDRENGKKVSWTSSETEPVLFGWQAIDDNAREVTLTEGEIDALTAWGYGFPALSVPFGGGKGNKQQWIEREFDRLARFERIYLALDMDAEGEVAAQEITERLGRHRCFRVTLPHKDLNECRQKGVSEDQIRRCFDAAQTLDPDELCRAGQFTNAVIDLFHPTGDREQGYSLPYGKVARKVLFRPGEMSIWTGASGHGKSQVLSHASVHWGQEGARVCIASLEMHPRQLLKRMVKQAGNVDRPTVDYIRAIMGWIDEWLLVFNLVGKSGVKRLLEVFEYARARYGCDVFVIDSLMRMGIGSEDYEGQEKAVFQIVSWAVEKGVHVHLVAHARKADQKNGGQAPETEDIKGASEIGSNAFNIISVFRNRKVEDKIRGLEEQAARGDEAAKMALSDMDDKPTVILNIAKQRNGDWEGKCGLWFNQETYQYRSIEDNRHGMRYVDWRAA